MLLPRIGFGGDLPRLEVGARCNFQPNERPARAHDLALSRDGLSSRGVRFRRGVLPSNDWLGTAVGLAPTSRSRQAAFDRAGLLRDVVGEGISHADLVDGGLNPLEQSAPC